MGEQKPLERRVLASDDVEFGDQIGKSVLRATVKSTGQELVFVGPQPHHNVRPEDIAQAAKVNQAVNEYFAQSADTVNGNNYPLCHGTLNLSGTTYLVRDYVPGTSLTHKLPMSTSSILMLGAKLATIVAGLNKAGYAKVNHHPSDFIISDEWKPTLINFYGAQPINAELLPGRRGTPGYRSPRSMRGEEDRYQDAWGVAAIVYDRLTKHLAIRDDVPEDEIVGQNVRSYYARTARDFERTLTQGKLLMDIHILRGLPKRGLGDLFTEVFSRGMPLNRLSTEFERIAHS